MIAIKNENTAPAFILGSLLSSYPDQNFIEYVGMIHDDTSFNQWVDGTFEVALNDIREKVGKLLESGQIDDLCSEYIDLFDRGQQVNSLYETEYGRERALVKGNELVDIAAFYKAFGLETGGDGVQAEMIDHISVELEFYALLLMKYHALEAEGDQNGMSIVLDARKKFLKSHLGRFVGAICERPGVVGSAFYSSVFNFCREITTRECERLGVSVEPVQWISTQIESESLACGGSVGCLK